jgi:hypothetical protein
MAKFLTGPDLEKVITDIIWEAEEKLIIVSPFIRLDEYFKELFKRHTNNHKLHLVVVFGKNEKAVNKSLAREDFEFFKQFMNVSIVYVPELHGKYYSNEKKGVITSINFHDSSFKNNIEFGVYSEVTLLNTFQNSPDDDAWNYCWDIAYNKQAVFIKRPVYEKKLLSSILGKSYIKSNVLYDITDQVYGNSRRANDLLKTLSEFPSELGLGSEEKAKPIRTELDDQKYGYCIRTGKQIPYNPKRPLDYQAYKVWESFGSNLDYPEKYCHKTGNSSNGKTSMRNPILK